MPDVVLKSQIEAAAIELIMHYLEFQSGPIFINNLTHNKDLLTMASIVIKMVAIFAVAFLVFSVSGWLAQLIFSGTSCVWTSSLGFGLSFLSLGTTVYSLLNGVMDLSHLF